MRDVFPRSRLLWVSGCSLLVSNSLVCLCSFLGQSFRLWRFKLSRIQSFWESLVGPPKVSIWRVTSGTWLAGVTFPTMTLARTTMGWAPRFLRQIGTQGDPRCNSPNTVASTKEVGSLGSWAGSASTWTHMQYPEMSVWLWILMVPNRGMVTLHVIGTCPWMLSRQKPLGVNWVGGCCRGSPFWGSHPPCMFKGKLEWLWYDHTEVGLPTGCGHLCLVPHLLYQ